MTALLHSCEIGNKCIDPVIGVINKWRASLFIIHEELLKENAVIKESLKMSVMLLDVLRCSVEKGISHISGLILLKVLTRRANLYAIADTMTLYRCLSGHRGLYIHALKWNIKLNVRKHPSSYHSIQSVSHRTALIDFILL